MSGNSIFSKLKISVMIILLIACVERITFDVPPANLQLVIEGMISDQKGPYVVKISQAMALDADSAKSFQAPYTKAKVIIYDDAGKSELLVEKEEGVYFTSDQWLGEVGRSYHIRIETPDGRVFESAPDKLNPVGDIEAIRYEYEPRTSVKSFGEVRADVFNVYVDGAATSEREQYVRWKYTGVYKVITYPAEHFTNTPPYRPYKNPWLCSGYIVTLGPEGSGGLLLKVGECTCCECWVKLNEASPQLSDTQLVSGGKFKNVKVGEVPITNSTFHEKFQLQVEQMSLTRSAYEFFKLIREQKQGASNIFQPSFGEIRGNIRGVNTNDPVIGLFWSTSIKKKTIFIQPNELPVPVTPIDYITLPCYDFYPNATNVKPEGWE